MHKPINLLLFFIVFVNSLANSQTPITSFPVTNTSVGKIVQSGNTIYIAGPFTYVGPRVPYGSAVNAVTGVPDLSFPIPNGNITAVAPDGSGGWYIGGNFTKLGTVTRNYIARINSDGTINAWNPGASSIVYALTVVGTTVYAGGGFTYIGGQARNHIAALDAATGSPTAWDPNINNTVRVISVNGATVYAGGLFTTVGGQTRNHIAALDAATGSATAWDPNADNSVYAIAVNGSSVYAGGAFASVGGQTRNDIAELDATTGAATTWNPAADNIVYRIR